MSVTLWIDSKREETIELGATLACYQAFSELRHKVPAFARDYAALDGVLTQCEWQEDAPPDWLADVRVEARRLLASASEGLSPDTLRILELLAGSEEPDDG